MYHLLVLSLRGKLLFKYDNRTKIMLQIFVFGAIFVFSSSFSNSKNVPIIIPSGLCPCWECGAIRVMSPRIPREFIMWQISRLGGNL